MSLEELLAAEADVAACRRALRRSEQLQQEVAGEQRVCQALRRRLRDERADVTTLSKRSPRSLIARLRGRHDEVLARERAEVDDVAEQLAAHEAALTDLVPRFEAERDLALRLDDAEARLVAATDRRAHELAASPEIAERVAELEHRLAVEGDAHEQFCDAHLAALSALAALDRAIDSLSTARNLSYLDMASDRRFVPGRRGGDMMSSLKHDHLDESVEIRAAVHAALLNLRPHLGLVSTQVARPNLSMPSSRWAGVDRWFDSFYTDLAHHRRIAGSLDDLRSTREHVVEMIDEVSSYEAISQERVDAARAEWDALLRDV